MNRFLLLALTAGLMSSIAANAESVWLLVTKTRAIEKIEMRDMEQCQTQGEIWKKNATSFTAFVCIEGK